MKSVLLLLALSFSAYSLQIEDLVGCYHAVEVDGQIVDFPSDEYRQISTIEYVQSPVFSSVENQQALNVLQISVLSKYDGVWYSYINYILPTDLATYSKENNYSLSAQMTGDVLFKKWYTNELVDHNIWTYFEAISSDMLKVKIAFESQARQMSNSNEFMIRKVECATID